MARSTEDERMTMWTVVADRELDSLYRQALQSATRSYCETT